ncbi:MAG TPA: Ig-like domain-containing protein [Candidatus Saccharimonadales bacterium]
MKLKIKTLLVALLTLAGGIFAPLSTAYAAGGGPDWPAVSLTANKTTATTNDTITVTARFFLYVCKLTYQSGEPITQSRPEGCDQYFGGTSGQTIDYPHSCPFPDGIVATLVTTGDAVTLSKGTICGNGSDTFTIKSSAAGAKTVTVALSSTVYTGSNRSGPTLGVNFTAPVAAKPKVVTPAPAPAPAPVVEKPAAPTVATIMVDDNEIKTGEEVSLTTSQPLVLSGKTVANGKVALWVFSEPKLYETTADAQGNWSVSVKDLPEGSHHAEVEVTNPANGQKSDRTKLLDFKVVADKKPMPLTTIATTKPKSKTGLWVGLIAGLLAVVAAGGALIWWKRKKKTGSTSAAFTPNGSAYSEPSDSSNKPVDTPESSAQSSDKPKSDDGNPPLN